ncbi:hypothetical protein D0C16_08025 [Cellvibrio sp. KY-GH-1]|uniref:hypothetical protein n=1 Tax=Cellvibrio sp. KY-GH-1 TaxID=2303332 RepID=UPI001244386A|nr:hypothetical protein [Cellvibrio sp. KY-GH-1]QEY15922.1 hypothetical protein D0C16_08025 [Cellvibrio sp. KY-GH-1]
MNNRLTKADLIHLPEADQNILFNYMQDLSARRESLLGILFIFVYLSMAVLLYLVSLTTPDNAPYSTVTELIWPFAAVIFTLATAYLICLRKPWNLSKHNRRVQTARQFFLENFNMDIGGLTPSDIWQGVVVERAHKSQETGEYLTFVQVNPGEKNNSETPTNL